MDLVNILWRIYRCTCFQNFLHVFKIFWKALCQRPYKNFWRLFGGFSEYLLEGLHMRNYWGFLDDIFTIFFIEFLENLLEYILEYFLEKLKNTFLEKVLEGLSEDSHWWFFEIFPGVLPGKGFLKHFLKFSLKDFLDKFLEYCIHFKKDFLQKHFETFWRIH